MQLYVYLLTKNEITCLSENKDRNIWIGTKEGLNVLNREIFHIVHFENDNIQSGIIRYMFAASNGAMWIGTGSSVLLFQKVEE